MSIFRSIRNFFADVSAEFKRVTWPSRESTLQSTGVVVMVSLFVAVFLGLVDLGLANAVKMIIK
ncbi:MAG: preprotein translocase subunit SecE [Deltaproteobacteria bacterium]|nr:preprotein translocase subunit SecE [Deltaproteobacteria bacterium]